MTSDPLVQVEGARCLACGYEARMWDDKPLPQLALASAVGASASAGHWIPDTDPRGVCGGQMQIEMSAAEATA